MLKTKGKILVLLSPCIVMAGIAASILYSKSNVPHGNQNALLAEGKGVEIPVKRFLFYKKMPN